MINIVYRGQGGSYANYLRQSIKKIAAHRQASISLNPPSKPGYRVAIAAGCEPLTASTMSQILERSQVTFFVGDSRGLPAEIVCCCDAAFSVSSLPVGHQFEAAILADQMVRTVLATTFPELVGPD